MLPEAPCLRNPVAFCWREMSWEGQRVHVPLTLCLSSCALCVYSNLHQKDSESKPIKIMSNIEMTSAAWSSLLAFFGSLSANAFRACCGAPCLQRQIPQISCVALQWRPRGHLLPWWLWLSLFSHVSSHFGTIIRVICFLQLNVSAWFIKGHRTAIVLLYIPHNTWFTCLTKAESRN